MTEVGLGFDEGIKPPYPAGLKEQRGEARPPLGNRMKIRQLRDKERIEEFLRRNCDLHVYSLGDLDDFFWPHTTWLGREASGRLEDIVLIYRGRAVPTVIGLSERPDAMREFVAAASPLLPERFHAHLSPGVEEALRGSYAIEPRGAHCKMALRSVSQVGAVDCSRVEQLSETDQGALLRFYDASYPGNWFDQRMLETKQYFGLRQGERLVSVAGVHVYSRRYRVAALGNIATDPAHRNRGYGKLVTARLCQALLEEVDHVGLNVKADNEAAMRCYRSLGFEIIGSYGEFDIRQTGTGRA
jgi:ribosomal protein S18 acetylase RimI-like enzyme